MSLVALILGSLVLAHEATARVYAEVATFINKRRMRRELANG